MSTAENTLVLHIQTGNFVTFMSRHGKRAHSSEYPDAILMRKSEAEVIATNLTKGDNTFKAINVLDYDSGNF